MTIVFNTTGCNPLDFQNEHPCMIYFIYANVYSEGFLTIDTK